MSDKVSTLFQSSPMFKEALATYAQTRGKSITSVVLEAVSYHIGYDLKAEPVALDGRRKYESDDARKTSKNNKAKSVRKLMELLEREEHLRDVLGITASLEKKDK